MSVQEDLATTGIGPLVDRIAKTVNQIAPDDLSGLAKMHSWCEALAAHTGSDENVSDVAQRACSLVQSLEALILGEVEDATSAFAGVVNSVSELAKAASGVSKEASPASVPTDTADIPAAEESMAKPDTEAQLAKVFDEDASEPQAPEETTPEPQAAPETTSDDEQEPYESQPLILSEKELDFVKGFVEEAGEHVEAIEAALLEVERTPDDTAKIDDLFRPFHTIKGIAGFLNMTDVNRLTHEAETLLDQGRKGKRAITPAVIDLVFDVVDILKLQIAEIGNWVASPTSDPICQPPVAEMIHRLRDIISGRAEPDDSAPTGGSPSQRVGENLVDQRAVAPEAVEFALQKQQQEPDKKVGEILVENKTATARQVSQAIRPKAQEASARKTGQKTAGDQSIRIDTGKLDALVDMVGELVIAQTLVTANPLIGTDARLTKDVDQVAKIVRDVQEVAMSMRMVPIGPTFQKMARLVRDVSRKAGKQVELTISGEDTELDKTVIQQIGDPLIHMVRNAVDHGVEAAEGRIAAGKPVVGHVHLSASHQGGSIVIEISDDGKGLDPASLLQKGIDKGLVNPGEELSDQQIFQLIFAPGFSMAKQVTDISGRGVGMDVVKRNIDQLRGKVEITSELGKGSTFSIRLPLTLAIIDGMVIRIGTERFILPTITIEQSLRPLPEQISTVQQKGQILNVRGQLIPLVQLGRLFRLTGRTDPCETMVVVTQCDGGRVGIVVDELIGQQQVVIKTLGERFQGLQGVSGAAILGDGRVGLILETSGIMTAHQNEVDSEDPETSETPIAGFDSISDGEVCTSGRNDNGIEAGAETVAV